jgi:uncharacterized protein (TIGR02246 family)
MSIDLAAFKSWLEAYGRAWESRDPQAAAGLFAEDGTYQVTPFLEPMRGRKAILEYWSQVARTEEDIRFGYEILAVTPEINIARWWASFVRIPPDCKPSSMESSWFLLMVTVVVNRCRSGGTNRKIDRGGVWAETVPFRHCIAEPLVPAVLPLPSAPQMPWPWLVLAG